MANADPIVGKVVTHVTLSLDVRRKVADSLNLSPIRTTSLTPADAPLLNGYPRAPQLWVEGVWLLSASGEYLNYEAPLPQDIVTTADTRFIANESYWDEDSMRWMPITTNSASWAIKATGLTSRPVLDTYEIDARNGVLLRDAFDISNGAYLVSDFEGARALSQTISLVIHPIGQSKNSPIIDWLNVADLNQVPEVRERTGIWATDKYDFYWSGTGASVDPVVAQAKQNPLFLTLVISPPQVTLYVSLSGNHHYYRAKAASDPITITSLNLGFGKSAFSPAMGSYRLFEVNFWADALDRDEVLAHHALMMSG